MSGEVAGRIALITDASACIPSSHLSRIDLRVVPINVQRGDEGFRSGVDLDDRRLYRALEQGLPVKSSAPSPIDYLDAIEEAGDVPCVIITPATEFTRMYTNASLAAELAGRSVTVVDSRSATAGHGLVVLAAAEARDAGGQPDDVVAAAEEAASRAELVACLETLEYLRQSGRVPALALGLANQLGIRPVFRLRNGTAERLGLPRSEQSALGRIVREWRAGGGPQGRRTAVFHAARPELAGELARMVGEVSFITEFSAAMAIHTGPGVVGVAWLRPSDGELAL